MRNNVHSLVAYFWSRWHYWHKVSVEGRAYASGISVKLDETLIFFTNFSSHVYIFWSSNIVEFIRNSYVVCYTSLHRANAICHFAGSPRDSRFNRYSMMYAYVICMYVSMYLCTNQNWECVCPLTCDLRITHNALALAFHIALRYQG